MMKKRPDYTEARNYYIKERISDIATNLIILYLHLRKEAANEGWLKKEIKNESKMGTIFR